MTYIKWLFSPLLFGVAFLTPLVAQLIERLAVDTGGIEPLLIGFLIGVTLGLVAQFRGSWLWIKPPTSTT